MRSIHASVTDSPSALILARAEAFRRCDFGFVYDSYHTASNFRRQFPDRDEYVRYGWACLGKDFRIHTCHIIRDEVVGDTARVIFHLVFELHGESQSYAELAWLELENGDWRYRCGQKLTADEVQVPLKHIDFHHFEDVADKVLY